MTKKSKPRKFWKVSDEHGAVYVTANTKQQARDVPAARFTVKRVNKQDMLWLSNNGICIINAKTGRLFEMGREL